MVDYDFIDFETGYKRYDSLCKNLTGLFDQTIGLNVNIDYYKNEFEKIKDEFDVLDKDIKSKQMPYKNMQVDYEGFLLTSINNKIIALTKKFEDEIGPLYNISKLYHSIDSIISNSGNIDNLINRVKTLLVEIDNIDTHNNIVINNLIDEAYKTVYNSLLYEKIYYKHEIFDFVIKNNSSSHRENLGLLIRNDLNDLVKNNLITKNEIDDEIIKHLDEGASYDFLSNEILLTISEKRFSFNHNLVDLARNSESKRITTNISRLNYEKENLNKMKDMYNDNIKRKRRHINLLKAKLLSLVMVPVITCTAGARIGQKVSENITEYATTTRMVDLNTGEIIGDIDIVYDEKPTSYVATFTVYEPWRKNNNSKGYIRNATTYEYNTPENINDDFHVTIDDLSKNVEVKYKYLEQKDELSENDSMTESTIILTETYQDKNNTKKSNKYIIPFAAIGLTASALIEVLLMYSNVLNVFLIRKKIFELNDEIIDDKKNNSELIEQYNDIVIKLEEENHNKENFYNKYGNKLELSRK